MPVKQKAMGTDMLRTIDFFPTRLNRIQYLVRSIIFYVIYFGYVFLLISMHLDRQFGLGIQMLCLIAPTLYVYLGLVMPRLKNAGLSPWLFLLLFVPVANTILWIILLLAPPSN